MSAFCPQCGRDSRITDSRKRKDLGEVRRVRECSAGHTWSTIEVMRERWDDLVSVERLVGKLAGAHKS